MMASGMYQCLARKCFCRKHCSIPIFIYLLVVCRVMASPFSHITFPRDLKTKKPQKEKRHPYNFFPLLIPVLRSSIWNAVLPFFSKAQVGLAGRVELAPVSFRGSAHPWFPHRWLHKGGLGSGLLGVMGTLGGAEGLEWRPKMLESGLWTLQVGWGHQMSSARSLVASCRKKRGFTNILMAIGNVKVTLAHKKMWMITSQIGTAEGF